MKQYYILKPKNLNLEKLVTKYKPDFKFNIDFAYLIIHWVILYQNKKPDANPVRLSSKYLKRYNSIYNKHIEFLIENFPNDGAVLRGRRYEKGKPYGYILPRYYHESELEIYTITNKALLRKISEIMVKKSTNEQIRLEYYFLLKYFNNGKLSVYEPSLAMERINGVSDKEKRLRNAKSLIRIMNGDTKLTLKPKTDGRVHSNITRMSKIARNHLQYDGEFLAEVDISSAIPFFLFLIMQYYQSNNLVYLTEFQYSNSIIYMLQKSSGGLVNTEVDDFGDSVLSKRLYQHFADLIFNEELYTSNGKDFEKVMKYYNYAFKKQFGHDFDGDTKDLLKFSKKRLLSMIFAKPTYYKFEQIVFESMYPTILKFINELKDISEDGEDKDNSKRHSKLAHCTFQFEAKTMIDKIAREYVKIHKGVPVFTLHDCLITTVSHVEELKKFMDTKFIELFGKKPNLTIEGSIFAPDYCEAC